ITPINMKLAVPLPDLASLHIMYLAPTILASAGLPLDDVYSDLLKMRDQNSNQDFQLLYLKKLVNSGLLVFQQ
ncbi:MAG: hypothetical protein M3R00_04435, partial [Pseudomonadota bacterium]|nr:hypothetical protein [Pseudomonadota bacterium]